MKKTTKPKAKTATLLPSYASLAREVVRAAVEPLTLEEVQAAVAAQRPITSGNPKTTIGNALKSTRLIASIERGRYAWVPRLLTGSVLRLPLGPDALAGQHLSFSSEFKEAGWPDFFETGYSNARHPLPVALEGGPAVTWPLVHFGQAKWGTPAELAFWEWLARHPLADGGALIVTVVDGPTRRCQARVEPRAQRDEAAVAARNTQLVGAVARLMSLAPWDLAQRLLVAGAYQDPVPPDPIAQVWSPAAWGEPLPLAALSFLCAPDEEALLRGFLVERVRDRVSPFPAPPRPPVLCTWTGPDDRIYRLSITLDGSEPPIWRTLEIPAPMSLIRLHETLQIAMGWTNSHLHEFILEPYRFAPPSEEDWEPIYDTQHYRVSEVLCRPGDQITYHYDFGDSWRHTVTLEAIVAAEAGVRYPRLLAGKRACPPEDVGGVSGYADLCAALADAQHPEHEPMREWVGEHFMPEAFDLAHANRMLEVWSRLG